MWNSYEDIHALAMRLGEKPRWYDRNGTPRFCDHHPDACADIYTTEVALLLISCQRCGTELPVQMSSFSSTISLASLVTDGTLHYGDPPAHDHEGGDYCHAGCTMNCWDLRVLEFWRMPRLPETARLGTRADAPTIDVIGVRAWLAAPSPRWERVPELEVTLPDARDPERVRRNS